MRPYQKTIVLLWAFCFLFFASPLSAAEKDPVLHDSSIQIVVNGKPLMTDSAPVLYHDFTLVPLRGIFEELGAEVKWDAGAKKITGIKDTSIVTLKIGNKTALKNGVPIQLEVEPKVLQGKTFVPLRFVSESLGASVAWDHRSKSIFITTGETAGKPGEDKAAEKSTSISSQNLEGKSSQSPGLGVLTFERALELAQKNSNALKKAKAEIERSEKVRESAADLVEFEPIGPGNGPDDAAARAALKGLVQADLARQIAERQYELQLDQLTYAVKKAYNTLLKREQEKKLADLLVEQTLWKRNVIEAKAKHGLASEFEFTQANNSYQEAKAQQAAAAEALRDAYRQLNHLLGMDPDARYTLSDLPDFTASDELDVNYQIAKVSASIPVWLAEQNVKMAELDVDLYTFNVPGSEPYKAKEIDLEKAKLSASDTKQRLADTVRMVYNAIKQMEEQYVALQTSLAKAEEALKLAQTKYEVGMATADEVFDAKVSVEQTRQKQLELLLQLDEFKMAFEKPWVLAGESNA